jgi:hypothetical protein
MIIIESSNVSEVTPRAINSIELKLCTEFQSMLKYVSEYFNKDLAIDELRNLESGMLKYRRYPFSKKIINNIGGLIDHQEKVLSAKSDIDSDDFKSSLSKNCDSIISSFLSGDYNAAARYTNWVNSTIDTLSKSSQRNAEKMSNNLLISGCLFSDPNKLVTDFDENDFNNVMNKDLSVYKYTVVDLPKTKMDDPYFIIYFIQHLVDSLKPQRINISDIKRFGIMNGSDNSDYNKLKDIVTQYLYSNEKKYIPEIVRLIDRVPSVRSYNEKLKRKIHVVYRGVTDNDSSFNAIMDTERKSRYVATSSSKRIAIGFATNTNGILHGEGNEGTLITYYVSPNAIMFDTRVVRFCIRRKRNCYRCNESFKVRD